MISVTNDDGVDYESYKVKKVCHNLARHVCLATCADNTLTLTGSMLDCAQHQSDTCGVGSRVLTNSLCDRDDVFVSSCHVSFSP